MLLKDRKELDELRIKKGKTDEDLAKERLAELEEEVGLDEKEVKLYLSELFSEDAVQAMSWSDKLAWVVQGLYQDLFEVNQQITLNGLKGTGQEEKIKELKEKKVEAEERRLKKEQETVKAQQEMGILPSGSVEQLEEMRQRGQEYAFDPESLELDTKFVKLNEKQLSQKNEYLTYRIKEREEELNELRNVTEARQKAHAKEVLERIGPKEYPT